MRSSNLLVGVGAAGGVLLGSAIAWRYAARRWQLPCPTVFGWVLESGIREVVCPTPLVIERMGVRAAMRVLEVGPGVGYLSVPVAQRLGETGRLVALEIQPQMARRTRARVGAHGLGNVEVRVGDVTRAPLEPATYDLAFLVTVLGEIPDRDEAISRLRETLRPGGVLSFTEIIGDPHYQRYTDLERRCTSAGLERAGRYGSWISYTANFRRPSAETTSGAKPPVDGG
jgi:protein-L-isoaspartate O-methyltransferase